MGLHEEFEASGNWLFRRRGYLPLVLFVPLAVTIATTPPAAHADQARWPWEVCCVVVSLFGLAVRIKSVGHAPRRTSGRSTKHLVAESLNTTGMYSIVRHPLYIGNFLMWLGPVLFWFQWQLLVMFCLAFWIYYQRIMFAEEQFLRRKFGTAFEDWSRRTPAVLPRFSAWRSPELPFSWRKILRKEYTGLSGVLVLFVLLKWVEGATLDHDWRLSPAWLAVLAISLVGYVALRSLKKLNSPSRRARDRDELARSRTWKPTLPRIVNWLASSSEGPTVDSERENVKREVR